MPLDPKRKLAGVKQVPSVAPVRQGPNPIMPLVVTEPILVQGSKRRRAAMPRSVPDEHDRAITAVGLIGFGP